MRHDEPVLPGVFVGGRIQNTAEVKFWFWPRKYGDSSDEVNRNNWTIRNGEYAHFWLRNYLATEWK